MYQVSSSLAIIYAASTAAAAAAAADSAAEYTGFCAVLGREAIGHI